jgi:hypothetical protein
VVVEGLDAGGLWLDLFEPVRRRLVGARRWHEIQPVAQAETNVRDLLELRPDVPALAFGRDGDLDAFDSAVAATRWMEFQDVADGEYEALFTVDGYPHSLSVDGETVRVRRVENPDGEDLTRRLERTLPGLGLAAQADDPAAVADELLRRQRRRR